jgi:nucleotide-binding universal stress UspA family protein
VFSGILVAFDGSDHAKRCLTDAVALARDGDGDGELTVLSVSLPVGVLVDTQV